MRRFDFQVSAKPPCLPLVCPVPALLPSPLNPLACLNPCQALRAGLQHRGEQRGHYDRGYCPQRLVPTQRNKGGEERVYAMLNIN